MDSSSWRERPGCFRMRVFKSIAAKRRTRKKFGGDQSSLFLAHGSDGLLSRKSQVKESLDSRHVRGGGQVFFGRGAASFFGERLGGTVRLVSGKDSSGIGPWQPGTAACAKQRVDDKCTGKRSPEMPRGQSLERDIQRGQSLDGKRSRGNKRKADGTSEKPKKA